MTVHPTHCDETGAVYFRSYKRREVFGAPITKLDARDQQVLSIDISKINDSSVAKAPTLKYTDFAVVSGTIYVPAANEDEQAYVLRLSADDGSFQSAIAMEDGFYPLKIAVFASGAFVVMGTRKAAHPGASGATLYSDSVLYDATGRPVKHLGPMDAQSAGASKAAIQPERLQNLTLALAESAGSSIYFLQPSAKPSLTVVHEDGTIETVSGLWTPGEGFLPASLRALGSSVLIEYVKDPEHNGSRTEFVLYDLSIGRPVAVHLLDDDVGGAFACYDWRNTYTFLSSHSGHRLLLTGVVR